MRCNMCFKDKGSLQPPLPKFPAAVCKGCYYEIDRVTGFLMHYGWAISQGLTIEGVQISAETAVPGNETPPKPPPKRRRKAPSVS